jgi:DNA-binding CsgD family transcriptional regulator
MLARIEAGRGLEADCRAHADEGLARGIRHGDGSAVAYALAALGLLELTLGDTDAAVERLEQLDGALGGMGVRNAAVVTSVPDLVEGLVRAGRDEDAASALAALTAPDFGELVWPRAAAARCRGLLADDDAYEACFEEALALHGMLTQRFEEARTELCFGQRLRRSKRVADAREHLRAAAEGFERLRAEPWAERARHELEATGERRRARGPETSELTPRELQVALIVARGATNREAAADLFLTTKTIEFHLGQIYRKLGLRSRTELAHRLASTGELVAADSGH